MVDGKFNQSVVLREVEFDVTRLGSYLSNGKSQDAPFFPPGNGMSVERMDWEGMVWSDMRLLKDGREARSIQIPIKQIERKAYLDGRYRPDC